MYAYDLTKTSNLQELRPDKEKAPFFHDIQQLFSGERHGHVGYWQYSKPLFPGDRVVGGALWDRFLFRSKDYYPLHSEISLIQKHVKDIAALTDEDTTIMDFGCGPQESIEKKILPILSSVPFKHYIPIDTCESYVRSAAEMIMRSFPDKKVSAYNSNYLTDQIVFERTSSVIGLLFGSSINNVEGHPDEGINESFIIDQLTRIKRIVGKDAILIIAYDTNQDKNSILRSYLHEDQIAFGANIMFRIERDLPVRGLDPQSWQYRPVWYEKSHQLCHTVYALKDQMVTLGHDVYLFQEGDSLILNNSYKYPHVLFESFAQQAGLKTLSVFMDDENRIALHIFKT